MQNYITLFDKNYLSRGIALYNSLVEHETDFTLHILTMDVETYDYLCNLKLEKSVLIKLSEIETEFKELVKIKTERNQAEYCWTLTPYCIQYALRTFMLPNCTYLDADIYFFSSPKILFENVQHKSVIIIEHNYTPKYDQTETSGKYCVQFMYFKNDKNGSEVLEWWRKQCEAWCFAKMEDGKFGDQKYLDDWITRFDCIYVPNQLGCGVAPWNIQKYSVIKKDNALYVQDTITKQKEELIFYHFHGVRDYIQNNGDNIWYLGSYEFLKDIKENIYKSYLKMLAKLESEYPQNFVVKPKYVKNKIHYSIKQWVKNIFQEIYHLINAIFKPLKIFYKNRKKEEIKEKSDFMVL